MLGSLLRPKHRRRHTEQSPLSSQFAPRDNSPWVRAAATRGASRRAHILDSEDDVPETEAMGEQWDGEEEDEEDGPVESTPLLPIFSASHLGTKAFRPR